MRRDVFPAPQYPALKFIPSVSAVLSGALLTLFLLSVSVSALAQGTLENPAVGGQESGIGIVSGWHCDASTIEIQFDQFNPLPASYGTSRNDTLAVCGDTDNGFGMLWNWNLLGPGQHTVRAFADGVEFDSRTIEVNTLGQEFVRNLNLRTDLMSLDIGKTIEITWQDGKQGFVITGVHDADYTKEDLLAVLSGNWSGSWNSPAGNGSVSLTIGDNGMGEIVVPNVILTNTGCATHGVGTGAGIDVNDPLIEALMDDGSLVEFEFLVTESFSAIGGTFWVASGSCEDTDGIFYLFHN